jgi:2-phospho-L-lactate transferase/gluconeogenesis factor (CofD/UPF0052 family)
MQTVWKRLGSLSYLARPLALTFVGIVLLSLGVAYFIIYLYREAHLPGIFWYLTLQFWPRWLRGIVLFVAGLAVLAAGIWRLSGVVVIPRGVRPAGDDELVVGFQRQAAPPRVAVLSGGAGILVLASFGRQAAQLTCITPVQDPVEYYYRAASLFDFENVLYVPPTAAAEPVFVQLDDGTWLNIKHNIAHDERLARRHVVNIRLGEHERANGVAPRLEVFRQAIDALRSADLIVLGPGSLFESILPNLLIPEIRAAIAQSRARIVYICNLMTEPGLTTGFSVADHIRQIKRFGGITPDVVLVNAQRIEPDIRQIYEAAGQVPVYLSPEEYEETRVGTNDRAAGREVVVEGAVVIEADLASSVVQLTASLDHPGESRTIRVLRHDPEKLTAALMGVVAR